MKTRIGINDAEATELLLFPRLCEELKHVISGLSQYSEEPLSKGAIAPGSIAVTNALHSISVFLKIDSNNSAPSRIAQYYYENGEGHVSIQNKDFTPVGTKSLGRGTKIYDGLMQISETVSKTSSSDDIVSLLNAHYAATLLKTVKTEFFGYSFNIQSFNTQSFEGNTQPQDVKEIAKEMGKAAKKRDRDKTLDNKTPKNLLKELRVLSPEGIYLKLQEVVVNNNPNALSIFETENPPPKEYIEIKGNHPFLSTRRDIYAVNHALKDHGMGIANPAVLPPDSKDVYEALKNVDLLFEKKLAGKFDYFLKHYKTTQEVLDQIGEKICGTTGNGLEIILALSEIATVCAEKSPLGKTGGWFNALYAYKILEEMNNAFPSANDGNNASSEDYDTNLLRKINNTLFRSTRDLHALMEKAPSRVFLRHKNDSLAEISTLALRNTHDDSHLQKASSEDNEPKMQAIEPTPVKNMDDDPTYKEVIGALKEAMTGLNKYEMHKSLAEGALPPDSKAILDVVRNAYLFDNKLKEESEKTSFESASDALDFYEKYMGLTKLVGKVALKCADVCDKTQATSWENVLYAQKVFKVLISHSRFRNAKEIDFKVENFKKDDPILNRIAEQQAIFKDVQKQAHDLGLLISEKDPEDMAKRIDNRVCHLEKAYEIAQNAATRAQKAAVDYPVASQTKIQEEVVPDQKTDSEEVFIVSEQLPPEKIAATKQDVAEKPILPTRVTDPQNLGKAEDQTLRSSGEHLLSQSNSIEMPVLSLHKELKKVQKDLCKGRLFAGSKSVTEAVHKVENMILETPEILHQDYMTKKGKTVNGTVILNDLRKIFNECGSQILECSHTAKTGTSINKILYDAAPNSVVLNLLYINKVVDFGEKWFEELGTDKKKTPEDIIAIQREIKELKKTWAAAKKAALRNERKCPKSREDMETLHQASANPGLNHPPMG